MSDDLTAAFDSATQRAVEVVLFGKLRDLGVPGEPAGLGAQELAALALSAAQSAPEGGMFVAVADAVRRYLDAQPFTEADARDTLNPVLTGTIINALRVAAEQAQRITAALTADGEVTH